METENSTLLEVGNDLFVNNLIYNPKDKAIYGNADVLNNETVNHMCTPNFLVKFENLDFANPIIVSNISQTFPMMCGGFLQMGALDYINDRFFFYSDGPLGNGIVAYFSTIDGSLLGHYFSDLSPYGLHYVIPQNENIRDEKKNKNDSDNNSNY